MDDVVEVQGVEWRQHPSLVVGEYVGAGSVGEANLRALYEEYSKGRWPRLVDTYPAYATSTIDSVIEGTLYFDNARAWIVVIKGGHGYKAAWLRTDIEEMKDILDGLDNYPLIEDQIHSEIEMEWEQEAWDCWAKADLENHLEEENEELYNKIWEWSDKDRDDLYWRAYMDAMEIENEYPETEYSSSYIPVDKIKDTWVRRVEWRYNNPDNPNQMELSNAH